MRILIKYIVLIYVVITASSYSRFQPDEVDVYKVKAAFIYNFTKFIEWNSINDKTKSFTIGVIGNSPVYEALKSLSANKVIGGKKIEIIKCKGSAEASLCKCEILFIPETINANELKAISEKFDKNTTLIISEKEGALGLGSTINFLEQDNHIKFEVFTGNINNNTSQIKISSHLLKLAINIKN